MKARALVALLVVAHVLLLERDVVAVPTTWDEPVYIGHGQALVYDGVTPNNPAPPWGFGLAQRATRTGFLPPDVVREDRAALGWRRLIAARQATVGVSAVGALSVAAVAARFSPAAMVLATALWAFSPMVLAHGALATLDVHLAGWLAAALAAGAAWWRAPTAGRAAMVAGVTALAVGSKLTAGAWVLVAAAGWAVKVAWTPGRRGALVAQGVVGAGVGLLVLWALYGFEVAPAVDNDGRRLLASVPMAHLVENTVDQGRHGFVDGHPNAILGLQSDRGWWWYFLVATPMKLTTGGLLVGVMAVAARARRRLDPWVDVALLAAPAIVFVVLSAGRTQLGVRYLLPCWPFVCVWVARAVDAGPRWRRLAGALILAGAVESVVHRPDRLSFFPVWLGGTNRALPLLPVGSDLCQGRLALQRYLNEHPPDRLFYLDCGRLGVDWPADDPECAPAPGLWAIHASELFRPRELKPGCLDWLRERPPDAILAHTIWVWDVPP